MVPCMEAVTCRVQLATTYSSAFKGIPLADAGGSNMSYQGPRGEIDYRGICGVLAVWKNLNRSYTGSLSSSTFGLGIGSCLPRQFISYPLNTMVCMIGCAHGSW